MNSFLAVPLLAFFLVQAPTSEVKLPGTPQGQVVAAYLEAFNAPGEERMRDFFLKYATREQAARVLPETRLSRFRQMKQRLGRLDLVKVVGSSDSAITVHLKSSEDGLVEFAFELEPTSPLALRGIRVEDLEQDKQPEIPDDPKANTAAWVAAVEDYLNQAAAKDQFSGAVLLARGDQVLFEKAFGAADKGAKIANRTDTRFNLGSINKIFTDIAIYQLAGQGKLSLEDKIGKFLPGYPNRDAATKVTIRHLLFMTSGIGDFFGERFEQMPKEKLKTITAYLPLFADKPLEFEPGSRSRYSNGGYVVLGAIIEKVSGSDYYSYVKKNIFQPAGMKDSDWYEKDRLPANTALGYTSGGPNYATLPGKGSSAGGGYSTLRDLLAFVLELRKGIISTPDFNPDGLGIAGGAPGINATLDSARGYVVIVLSNYDPPAAVNAARQIRAWMPR
jgi:D-alanyl-D-alanine carboxypeptidase